MKASSLRSLGILEERGMDRGKTDGSMSKRMVRNGRWGREEEVEASTSVE